MDLLRSVLSRQPLEKLKSFSPSEKFYRFRKELIIPERNWSESVSAELFFVSCGELVTKVPPLIGYGIVLYRALFFLSAPYLLHYMSTRDSIAGKMKPLSFAGSPVPLEQFLETNVPEIQALGLAEGWFSIKYYDYSRVNWNDKLIDAVRKYIPKIIDTYDKGLIEIKLPSYFDDPVTDVISYIQQRYQGKEVISPDPLVDKFNKTFPQYSSVLIRLGYFAHINFSVERRKNKVYALASARSWPLFILKEVTLPIEEINLYFEIILTDPIDEKLRQRVDYIYKTPDLWSSIPKIIQESYKMILGIVGVDDPLEALSILAVKIGYPRKIDLWYKEVMTPNYFNPQDICYSPETAYKMVRNMPDDENEIMAPVLNRIFRLSYSLGKYLGNLVPIGKIIPPFLKYEEPINYQKILEEIR